MRGRDVKHCELHDLTRNKDAGPITERNELILTDQGGMSRHLPTWVVGDSANHFGRKIKRRSRWQDGRMGNFLGVAKTRSR